MSQTRLSMRKIRELLRLKYDLGRSHRENARSLGIDRHFGERLRAAGKRGGLLLEVAGGAGRRGAVGGAVPGPAANACSPAGAELGASPPGASAPQGRDAAAVVAGVPGRFIRTATSTSWFCERYRAWRGRIDVVMRQVYRAGEKVLVRLRGPEVRSRGPGDRRGAKTSWSSSV